LKAIQREAQEKQCHSKIGCRLTLALFPERFAHRTESRLCKRGAALCFPAPGCLASFPNKGFGLAEQCSVNSNLPACSALIAVCVNIVAAERWLFDGFGAAPVFFCAMALGFADAGRLQGYSAAIGADDGGGFRGQLSRAVFFLRHSGLSVFDCFFILRSFPDSSYKVNHGFDCFYVISPLLPSIFF